MTIDEAIQSCKEIAAETTEESGYDECKAKLLQLVDWLEELKTLRTKYNEMSEKYNIAKSDCDLLVRQTICLNDQIQSLTMRNSLSR